MRKKFTFSLIGLQPGQKLVSVFDKNQTATIEDDKHIRFRGELTNLTKAAMTLAKEAGHNWPTIQGPMYWTHNGKKLVEIRERQERKQAVTEAATSQSPPAKLIDALRSVVQKSEAIEKTKAFVQNEKLIISFADAIQNGSERAAFLAIPEIDAETYENLRTILNGEAVGEQKIVAKRGRAGGLALVDIAKEQQPKINEVKQKEVEDEAAEIDRKALNLEKDYYPLVKAWAEQEGYTNCEIVGGKLPGFSWENPDLIAIDYLVNKYTRSAAFDITSFEVKLRVTPSTIWQAAHYKHFSREVYVAFAKDEKTIRAQDDERVFDLAIELGLGVLAFEGGKFKLIQSPKPEAPQEAKVYQVLSNYDNVDVVEAAMEEVSETLNRFYDEWFFGLHPVRLTPA
jgi:hypothetical protein